MNTNEALSLLKNLLGDFDIAIHPRFLSELRDLLKKDLKGKEEQFFKLLTTQLNNMRTFGIMVYTVDENEQLKGFDGHYYSIHLQQKQFNVRMLVHISDGCKCSLLSIFYERTGKKATGYAKHSKTLLERLAEMEEM